MTYKFKCVCADTFASSSGPYYHKVNENDDAAKPFHKQARSFLNIVTNEILSV